MVSLPVSHSPAPSGGTLTGRFRSFRTRLVEFGEVMGAAIRVSRAVEARQPPHPDDLAALGIKGPLPRTW